MAKITSIFYYVPQDSEAADEFNAFPVFKPSEEIRLKDIRDNFPLPGLYHFRFQHLINKKTLVWIDLNNEEAPLPQVEGKVLVKAL